MKLKNRYVKAGRLESSDGKDLGELAVALVSDMTKGDVQIGPMNAMQHLRQGVRVQKNSYLEDHQILPAADAGDVIANPNEKYYTGVVAELNGKGVGYAAIDKANFTDKKGKKTGEQFVKMFYVPTIVTKGGKDFSNSNVVKGNGHREPLEQLILRLSLDRVGGRNLLSVFDGPDAELPSLAAHGYRALAPKFDIPSAGAKTSADFSQVADQVYMVVKLPEGQTAKQYKFGVELSKAFQLYNNQLREGYIDEWANVRGNREFHNRRIDSAMGMYNDGIKKLVESAVKVGDKIIVPYKDMQISGAAQLTPKENEELTQKYLKLGKEAVKHYKKYFPKTTKAYDEYRAYEKLLRLNVRSNPKEPYIKA